MLRKLKKAAIYHYIDGVKTEGAPAGIWGHLTGVTGDLTGVWGDLTGVTGDLSDIWGDLTGVTGDLTGVTGDLTGVTCDLDDCGITEQDRLEGVHVDALIGHQGGD